LRDKNYLTHNFHPYPAKFVPHIPRAIIKKYTLPGQLVVDPFCGSGTTLVEACLEGRPSIGNDLNPIASLMSEAKTTKIEKSHVNELDRLLLNINNSLINVSSMSYAEVADYIPSFKNRDHWFDGQSLLELGHIKMAINQLVTSQSRALALTAFSAIIVKVSRQESDTRWVAITKNSAPGFALRSFAEKLSDMIPRSLEFSRLAISSANITQCDATSLHCIPSSVADLILTSPPYMNSYDYYLYHKLRMFWLGYDHKIVQNSEIGSRNRHCDQSEGLDSYRHSIKSCLQNFKRVLKPSGILAIVIGDSIYKGELIPMDSIYDGLCEKIGFSRIVSYHFEQRKYTASFTRGYKTLPKRSHVLIYSN
jgi:site-specific DNA-methyltransferase (cytosine-N4-specific)